MTTTLTEDQIVEQPELEQFFADVGYRVELAEKMQQCLDHKLATKFNIFNLIEPDENKLSDILADLLDPKGTHGQGDLFLRRLFEQLGIVETGKLGEDAIVQREALTDKISNHLRRIDLLVRAGVLLAIENKVDSFEQTDQVKDYLEYLCQCAKEKAIQTVLIYLTPNGRKPKSLALPALEELQKSNKLHCWSYQVELRAWLEACRRDCEAERIRHFLSDFIAYIESDLKRESDNDDEPLIDEH